MKRDLQFGSEEDGFGEEWRLGEWISHSEEDELGVGRVLRLPAWHGHDLFFFVGGPSSEVLVSSAALCLLFLAADSSEF